MDGLLEEKLQLSPLTFTPSQESDSHEKLKKQIEGWLKDEEISFEERSTPSHVSYFQLKASVQDFPIYVQELNQKRGCLMVHSSLSLGPHQLSAVLTKTPEEKAVLRGLIFSFLNTREFSFRIDENPEDKRWIMIQRILYVENLTREKLMGEIKDLRIRFRIAQEILDESLRSSG